MAYIMGDVSGLGFGSVIWGQGKMVSESGEFTPLVSREVLKILKRRQFNNSDRGDFG